MTKPARNSSFLLAIACAAAGCAAPGYNPPEGGPAAQTCPASEVWVCQDRYPSRLENENEPPMICTCQDPNRIH